VKTQGEYKGGTLFLSRYIIWMSSLNINMKWLTKKYLNVVLVVLFIVLMLI